MNSGTAYLAAASLALGATGAVAQAPPATPAHDVQCLLISGAIASGKDPAPKARGMMGSMFFLGKLFAVDPNFDLKAALQREYSAMTPQVILALQPQCSAELAARSQQLSTAGDTLQPPSPPIPQK